MFSLLLKELTFEFYLSSKFHFYRNSFKSPVFEYCPFQGVTSVVVPYCNLFSTTA